MFCHLNQDTASVLSIPSNCTLISTHFWQHPYMQTMFSVSHVYNSIISCKLAVLQSFLLCIVSTMYWRLSCCLQKHVSPSESLGRVTQNGLHRKKASMAYIDVGIFYNKFLVEFSYAVEHNSPLFFSLLFVKVTLITDVIHLDISASSLGDTIVVFRDPYLFSDDIVSVFHRTTKQWLCKKMLSYILFFSQ